MLTALPAQRNGSAANRRPTDRSRDPIGWRLLAEAGTRRLLPRGAVLTHTADRRDALVLVEEGAVKVVGIAENGTTAVLAIRSAGSIVCEFAVPTGERHLTSVLGVLPAMVVTVPMDKLPAALHSRPATAQLLLETAVARVHEADRRRVEYASCSIPERICYVLHDLAEQFRFNAGPGVTVIPLVQNDVGALAGASREATAKVLRRLRQAGAIRTQRSRIVVLRAELISPGF